MGAQRHICPSGCLVGRNPRPPSAGCALVGWHAGRGQAPGPRPLDRACPSSNARVHRKNARFKRHSRVRRKTSLRGAEATLRRRLGQLAVEAWTHHRILEPSSILPLDRRALPGAWQALGHTRGMPASPTATWVPHGRRTRSWSYRQGWRGRGQVHASTMPGARTWQRRRRPCSVIDCEDCGQAVFMACPFPQHARGGSWIRSSIRSRSPRSLPHTIGTTASAILPSVDTSISLVTAGDSWMRFIGFHDTFAGSRAWTPIGPRALYRPR